MKKLITLIVLAMVVFTLSSCTTEEVEITIIVYSQDPEQMISDLEDLPEIISNELSELGYIHDRIVLQSSDQLSVIQDGLNNGTVDLAIINGVEVTSDSLIKVLSVVRDEINHPAGNMDGTTSQQAIVVSPSINGDILKDHMESNTVYDFTMLNSMDVCATKDSEDELELFATYMGMTAVEEALLTVTPVEGTTQEVFEGLEDLTCDLGIVNLEDIGTYAALWEDNDANVLEDLTVLYVFEPVLYGGLYASEDVNLYLKASLVQTFIQLSARNSNKDILGILGHSSYYIPE